MKVLHINCNYLGTTLHQCMVEHLDRLGVDSTVFVPTCSPEDSVILPNENVFVSKCFRKQDRLSFFCKQKKIQKALEENLLVETFDLIHAYTLFTDGNCAYEMSKKYGINYVVAIRNTDVNSFFKCRPHLIGRGVEIMKHAKYIFFLSETYKQRVLKKYVPARYRETFEKKSRVMPNGIDDFWLQKLQTNTDRSLHTPLRLAYAGKIDANKNIATTQMAMKLLAERGYGSRLVVVGKVVDPKVFARVSNNALTTCIPPKNRDDLAEIYRTNDIFVMPSFKETFGLVYAEAISQGLPVVYSAGEGFDKQFEEGEVGYSVDPHSAECVADAILKTVQNYKALTVGLPSKAKRYDWNVICRQYYEIYQSIV